MGSGSDDKSSAGQGEMLTKIVLIRSVEGLTYSFDVLENESDGSCLFRAISQALYARQSGHVEIRQNLIDFITHPYNWEKYFPFLQAQHDGLVEESSYAVDDKPCNNDNDCNSNKSQQGQQGGVDSNNNNVADYWTDNNSDAEYKSSSMNWKKLYVSYMRCGVTYGTLQELQAASELYEFNLIVIRVVRNGVYNIQNFDEAKWMTTQVFYFTGSSESGHFELLQPTDRCIQLYNYKYHIPNGDYMLIAKNRWSGLAVIKPEMVPNLSQSQILEMVNEHLPPPPADAPAWARGIEDPRKIKDSSSPDDSSGKSAGHQANSWSARRKQLKKSLGVIKTCPKFGQSPEVEGQEERKAENEAMPKESINCEWVEKARVITKEPVNNVNVQQLGPIPGFAQRATSLSQVDKDPLQPTKAKLGQMSSQSKFVDSGRRVSSSGEDEVNKRSSRPSTNISSSEPASNSWTRSTDSGSKQGLLELTGIPSSTPKKYYENRRDGRETFKDLNNQYKKFKVTLREGKAAFASLGTKWEIEETFYRFEKNPKPIGQELREFGSWMKDLFCFLFCCCIYSKKVNKSRRRQRQAEYSSGESSSY